MAQATLIYSARLVYPDGAIREMIIWKLPAADRERPHGIKCRLYYGTADGTCIVRYDNERGKGGHRHFEGYEGPYWFRDVETLVHDFQRDIDAVRRGRS